MNLESSLKKIEIKTFLIIFHSESEPRPVKINVFDIFNIVNFFQIFVISRNNEILAEWNFWPSVYA